MISIVICLGNVCSQTDESDEVAAILEHLIRRQDMADRVEMSSTFCKDLLCMDGCSQGICLRVNEKVFRGVTPESVRPFFNNEILPLV